MQVIELNHTAIYVSDVETSARFYGETLGFPVLQRPAFSFPGAWFRLGTNQELHLIGERLAQPFTEETRGGHFAMRVDDIGEAAKLLKGRGSSSAPPAARTAPSRSSSRILTGTSSSSLLAPERGRGGFD